MGTLQKLGAVVSENAAGPSLAEFDSWLAEKHAEWERKKRQDVVSAMLSEYQWSKEHGPIARPHQRILGYWARCGVKALDGRMLSEAELEEYARRKAWCGSLVLSSLHKVSLTDVPWRDGKGFVYQVGLLPTHSPKPGDVCYQDDPYQHYSTFLIDDGPGFLSVDGNQPAIKRVTHTDRHGVTFFSIAPLLREAIES